MTPLDAIIAVAKEGNKSLEQAEQHLAKAKQVLETIIEDLKK